MNHINSTCRLFLTVLFLVVFISCQHSEKEKRKEISLNGQWQIAKTKVDGMMPSEFHSSIPVPGLVDMANPAIDIQDTAYNDAIYWYKRNFILKEAEKVQLKINMAKYHTKVWLNGDFVGENLYNFTPGFFDLKPFLKPDEKNELIISVGCENNASDTVMTGHDFEKIKYIPGIYDEIKIISSGYPHISNVQTVPNIDDGIVRIVASVEKMEAEKPVGLSYKIVETASKRVVKQGRINWDEIGDKVDVDFTVNIENPNLWSPESPFLYTLHLETEADNTSTRFGMRSFRANPDDGPYLLNGKPYYMRGTNVCILRFFEDPDRAGLPWDDEWVIKLHNRFKEMGWNSIRYCIGFPPARWYEIADSLGFLIQNEYPIWTLGQYEKIYPKVTSENIANEFRQWLPEHWNHPCVVIWDAQNESVAPVTTDAIKMVRHMDLSNRLWENGWSAPVSKKDPYESHPYLFIKYRHKGAPSEKGAMSDFLNEVRYPDNDVNNHLPKGTEPFTNPIIINEYAWLWLNRDGSTTTLTDRVYDVCFGENLTKSERIDIYMKHLGMLTEYWRAHRTSSGVLHFCGLGYSRPNEPRGQTSDHFIDIKNLVFEPKFVQYVKPAFSPVGLMINFWEQSIEGGTKHEFEIFTINDLDTEYNGNIKITLLKQNQNVENLEKEIVIQPYGRTISGVLLDIPKEKGYYSLAAEIEVNGEKIRSIRELEVK